MTIAVLLTRIPQRAWWNAFNKTLTWAYWIFRTLARNIPRELIPLPQRDCKVSDTYRVSARDVMRFGARPSNELAGFRLFFGMLMRSLTLPSGFGIVVTVVWRGTTSWYGMNLVGRIATSVVLIIFMLEMNF